jgi:hypothetical protein
MIGPCPCMDPKHIVQLNVNGVQNGVWHFSLLVDGFGFVEEAYCDNGGPLVDKHVGIDGLGNM